MKIQHDYDTYVRLWRLLRRTRRLFQERHVMFCPRRILQEWLPAEATDEFIYDVCRKAGLEGYGLLPSPLESAFESRNFLIAFVSRYLDTDGPISVYPLVKRAFREVYPNVKISVMKRKKEEGNKTRNPARNKSCRVYPGWKVGLEPTTFRTTI